MAENEDGLVKVTTNGKDFMVPKNMAEAMNAQSEQFTTQVSTMNKALSDNEAQHQQQLTDLNTQFATKIQDMAPVVPAVDNFETSFYEDPKAAFDTLRDEVKQEIAASKKEMTETYTQDQIRLSTEAQTVQVEKDFWAGFYKEQPDLKGHEMIVKGIMARDNDTFTGKSLDEIGIHLADETRKYFMSINPNYKSPDIHTENPSNIGQPAVLAESEEKVVTLSQQLRSRAKARANAKLKHARN